MTSAFKTLLVSSIMLLGIWGAHVLTPVSLYKKGDWVEGTLAAMVPNRFGDWRLDEQQAAQVISPDQAAWINKLYSETVVRTYVNPAGARIMLSLAYGADQGRALQVHKPESCYAAQGFKVFDTQKDHTSTALGDIPTMRVVTVLNTRREPVTYWIRSGDFIVRGWLEQQVSRVRFGLKGYLPDGLLVRVSSISADDETAFKLQDEFIGQMTEALSPQARQMFLGEEFLQTNSLATAGSR